MLFPKPITAFADQRRADGPVHDRRLGLTLDHDLEERPRDAGTTLPQTPQGSLVLGGGVASNARNDHQMDVFSVNSLGRLWTMWWVGDPTGSGAWHGPLLLSDPGSPPRVRGGVEREE